MNTKKPSVRGLIVILGIALLSYLMAGFALRQWNAQRSLNQIGEVTQGTIIRRSPTFVRTIYVVFSFEAQRPDGSVDQLEHQQSISTFKYFSMPVGSSVLITYDPANPQNAQLVDTEPPIVPLCWSACGFTLVALTLAYYLLYFISKR